MEAVQRCTRRQPPRIITSKKQKFEEDKVREAADLLDEGFLGLFRVIYLKYLC